MTVNLLLSDAETIKAIMPPVDFHDAGGGRGAAA
jgi:hypothetical protein